MNENVRLRNISKEDVHFLYTLLKERLDYSKDLDFISPSEFPSFEKHVSIIDNFLNDDSRNFYDSFHIIQFKENDVWINVGSMVMKKNFEWGYHILKKYWDQGIGTKAFHLLLELNKNKRLFCKIKPENKRAIHNMDKFGFKLKELTFVKEPTD